MGNVFGEYNVAHTVKDIFYTFLKKSMHIVASIKRLTLIFRPYPTLHIFPTEVKSCRLYCPTHRLIYDSFYIVLILLNLFSSSLRFLCRPTVFVIFFARVPSKKKTKKNVGRQRNLRLVLVLNMHDIFTVGR